MSDQLPRSYDRYRKNLAEGRGATSSPLSEAIDNTLKGWIGTISKSIRRENEEYENAIATPERLEMLKRKYGEDAPVVRNMENRIQLKQDNAANKVVATGADGIPRTYDLRYPPHVKALQELKAKEAPTLPETTDDPPVTPETPLETVQTLEPAAPAPAPEPRNMKDSSELERMTAWVNASEGNRKLAEKVKPGQAGYEEIQIALGRMPFMPDEEQTFKSTDEGVTNPAEAAKAIGIDKLYDAQVPVAVVDPQEFANNAVMKVSDALKMESVLPNNAEVAEAYAASVPDDAFTRPVTPEMEELVGRSFTGEPLFPQVKGLNFRTGARQ